MQPMTLTEEQLEFRRTLRRFCDERIAPRAAEVDRTGEFPWESFKECVAMDLPALGIPEAFGGTGADHVTQSLMVEEIARACGSTSLALLISKLGMIPVMHWGSEQLKAKYLPRVAKGEAQASYCLSEADAGSDVAAMATRAVRDGDHYVISGAKHWITNAGISDTYTVFAKTDVAAGHRGITAFLVEADWGVRVAKLEDKLGMRGSPTGEVVFDEVRVPAANRIGEEGAGFYIAMGTLDRSRPTIGAQAVGLAQGAFDHGVAYLKERQQFGRPIAELQGLQFMVADMATRIEAARTLVQRACAMVDEVDGHPSAPRHVTGRAGGPDGQGGPGHDLTTTGAMAKMFASDVAMSVAVDSLQLLGGNGYTRDFPLERILRDTKVTQIYEGTNQVQKVVISRRVMA